MVEVVMGTNHHHFAIDAERETVLVATLSVKGHELIDLPPLIGPILVAGKNVGGTGFQSIRRVQRSACQNQVPADCDGARKAGSVRAIGGKDFFRLAPLVEAALVAVEHISGPGVVSPAGVELSSDDNSVPADRRRQSEV